MRFNRALKRTAIAVGRLIPRADPSTRRVVLCYHSVHPNRGYASSSPETFERQLEWLTQHCRIVPFADVASFAPAADAQKPTVAVTFDDGYSDNHTNALPLLVRHGVHATFFLTTGFISRDPVVLHRFERLLGCPTEDFPPLDWTQVRELHDAGMSIGSHTHSHPNLSRLAPSEAEEELRVSRNLIGERLGGAVDLFAYPFGKPRVHFTPATSTLVRAAGYRVAAAVIFRGVLESDRPYRVPRFFTDGDSTAKLEAKVAGAYDLIGCWQEHAPLRVMRLVSPLDFQK